MYSPMNSQTKRNSINHRLPPITQSPVIFINTTNNSFQRQNSSISSQIKDPNIIENGGDQQQNTKNMTNIRQPTNKNQQLSYNSNPVLNNTPENRFSMSKINETSVEHHSDNFNKIQNGQNNRRMTYTPNEKTAFVTYSPSDLFDNFNKDLSEQSNINLNMGTSTNQLIFKNSNQAPSFNLLSTPPSKNYHSAQSKNFNNYSNDINGSVKSENQMYNSLNKHFENSKIENVLKFKFEIPKVEEKPKHNIFGPRKSSLKTNSKLTKTPTLPKKTVSFKKIDDIKEVESFKEFNKDVNKERKSMSTKNGEFSLCRIF